MNCPHCGKKIEGYMNRGLERAGPLLKTIARQIAFIPHNTIFGAAAFMDLDEKSKVYNAIHYLIRRGTIRRVSLGKYMKMDGS